MKFCIGVGMQKKLGEDRLKGLGVAWVKFEASIDYLCDCSDRAFIAVLSHHQR